MKTWIAVSIIILLTGVIFLLKQEGVTTRNIKDTHMQNEAWRSFEDGTFLIDFPEEEITRETGIHEFSLGTTYVSETFSTTEFSVTVRYLPDSVLLNGADVLLPYFLTQNEGEIVYAKRGVYEGGQSIDFLFENGIRGRIILTDRALYELYGREGNLAEHFLNSLSIH